MEGIDWKHRTEYMLERHGVATEEADEAANDVDALWFDPDPKSRSGLSARVIGYSPTAMAVLVVILLHSEDETGWIGVNGWRANATERRAYREGAS